MKNFDGWLLESLQADAQVKAELIKRINSDNICNITEMLLDLNRFDEQNL